MKPSEHQEEIFDHSPSAEELAELYRKSQETDPASIHYKRDLVRPDLHIVRVCLSALLVIAIALLVALGVHLILETVLFTVLSGVAVILLSLILFAKRILIWFVKVYQRFASDKTRNRCRFEPSCSQYMILALEKYGFFKGLAKGIGRIRRCKPPNGGIDLP